MAPRTFRIEELAAQSAGPIGASEWYEITPARINEFADATEDHHWIHVDREQSASGPFGDTIAHGFLTLSLVPKLLRDVIEITDMARGANYGLEQVRFTSPVVVHSRIRMVADFEGSEWRDDGGLLYRIRLKIEIEGQERPALVGTSLLLCYGEGALDQAVN